MTTVIPCMLVLAVTPASAQWVQTNGLYGGSIDCFAASGTTLSAWTDGDEFLSSHSSTTWTEDDPR